MRSGSVCVSKSEKETQRMREWWLEEPKHFSSFSVAVTLHCMLGEVMPVGRTDWGPGLRHVQP